MKLINCLLFSRTKDWGISKLDQIIKYLKSASHLPKRFWAICLIETPLEVMKNAFYFILKAVFVLKICKFLSRPFGHVGKTAWLER